MTAIMAMLIMAYGPLGWTFPGWLWAVIIILTVVALLANGYQAGRKL